MRRESLSATEAGPAAGGPPTISPASGGQKRPAPWDHKRRSAKACLSCRNRKVRCDVLMGGQPCTNCRLDGLECVVKEPNRGRRPGSTAAAVAAARAAKAASANARIVAKGTRTSAPEPSVASTSAMSATAVVPFVPATTVSTSTPIAIAHTAKSIDSINGVSPQTTPSPQQPPLASSASTSLPTPSTQRPRSRSPSRPTGADDLIVTLTFDSTDDDLNAGGMPCDRADDQYVPDPLPHLRFRRRCSMNATALLPENSSVRMNGGPASSTLRSAPSDRSAPSVHPSIYSAHSTPANMGNMSPPSTRLPSYIRPMPAHIGPRDLEYLAEKGALTIVDDEFRDELLRIYVNHVYPFMPAVDLTAFVGAIVEGPCNGTPQYPPVSLLLFQAVIFASVTFADARFLSEYGFSSPKEARKVFFGRVRLLYGMDCEADQRAVLQATLLMTYWYDSPDDGKDTWYWMGIALTLAQVEGLHRSPKHLGALSLGDKQLRRRIWWSCVMRDRLLALAIRRPTRILDEEFDCPPLCLKDFGILDTDTAMSPTVTDASPRDDPLQALFANDPVYNTATRRALAVMAVELSRLCICIGHILHSQYTVIGEHPVGPAFLLKAFVVPKRSDEQALDLDRCDRELLDWQMSLHDTSRYDVGSLRLEPSDETDLARFKAQRVTHLHQALLQLIYLTASSVLHRPQAGRSDDKDSTAMDIDPALRGNSNASRATSRTRVSDAAIRITKIAFDLQCSKQLRFMSTSCIPAFLSACLIHLMDIRSSNEEVRNIGIGRFYQCLQALQELQDVYASAVYALRFIVTVLHNTDVRVPMLPMFQSALMPSLVGAVRDGRSESRSVRSGGEGSTTTGQGRTHDRGVSSSAPSASVRQVDADFDPVSALARMNGVFGWPAMGISDDRAMGHQQQPSLLAPYGHAWPPNSSEISNNMVHPDDMVSASLATSQQLADMDGLVPGMISFDLDPNAVVGGAMSFM